MLDELPYAEGLSMIRSRSTGSGLPATLEEV
jgi:hypothetical protein